MNEIELFTRHSHEYTEDTLRSKLSESLTQILRESRKRKQFANEANSIHFDNVLLRKSLRRIDWKQLCCDYNTTCKNRDISSNISLVKMKSTPLELLLECFENPLIWPCACTTSIFCVLVEVLCTNYSLHNETSSKTFTGNSGEKQSLVRKFSEWAPWQNRILNHLTLLLQRNAWMHNIAFWTMDNKIWLLHNIDSPYNGEVVLQMLCYWLTKFSRCNLVWLSLLSELIVFLDGIEESLKRSAKADQGGCIAGNTEATMNPFIKSFSTRKRLRGQSVFDIQLLHGETLEELDGRGPTAQNSYFEKCVRQFTQRHASSVANDLLNLWKIKAKSIEVLLTCSQRIIISWTIQKPVPFQSDPLAAIFHELLDTVCTHPYSATMRMSCILLANDLVTANPNGRCIDGLDRLLSLTWRRAVNSTKRYEVETLVHYFCDLINTCAKYDTQETLIEAITPLLLHLDETSIAKDDEQRCVNNIQQIYREGFANILSCRGMMLISPSHSPCSVKFSRQAKQFKVMNIITKLSLLYDQRGHWINSSLIDSECTKLLQGLQLVGILGLGMTDTGDVSLRQNSQHKTAVPWAYDSTIYILILRRLSPWLPKKMDEIFTQCNNNKNNTLVSRIEPTKQSNSKLTQSRKELSILDILQEDTFFSVFSFLNYKRLLRMRLVCTSWKILSDKQNLWYHIYIKRYSEYKLSPNNMADASKNRLQMDWKKLFVDRHSAERTIRFETSKKHPAWKVRLCNHVNCLVVLKSPEFMRKHYKSHKIKYKCKKSK